MQVVDYREVTAAVLALLDEKKGKYFKYTDFLESVAIKSNCSNKSVIGSIVKALIASGLIGGRLKGATCTEVYHKSDGGDSAQHSAAAQKEIAELKSRLEMATSTVEARGKVIKELEIAVNTERNKPPKVVEIAVEKYIGVKVYDGEKEVKTIPGLFHKEFARIYQLAQARMNIFIYGPTGCGKSHVCEQLANALELPFAFVSCTSGMSEGVLAGRLLPVGSDGMFSYVMSEFVTVFENGGVFLLDEIDAADPNVLLLINAALANGIVSIPNRVDNPYARRHPDFICVAAANTAGTNGDRQYSGRNKLDGSTLDRFQVGKVVFDYDYQVEKALCPDPDLLARMHKIRQAIDDNRLERAMSTRFIRDAYRMQTEYEWTMADIDKAYFAGWREDEMNKVLSAVGSAKSVSSSAAKTVGSFNFK